jgi:hypothetical protein
MCSWQMGSAGMIEDAAAACLQIACTNSPLGSESEKMGNDIQGGFHVPAKNVNDLRIETQPCAFQFHLNAGGFKGRLPGICISSQILFKMHPGITLRRLKRDFISRLKQSSDFVVDIPARCIL